MYGFWSIVITNPKLRNKEIDEVIVESYKESERARGRVKVENRVK